MEDNLRRNTLTYEELQNIINEQVAHIETLQTGNYIKGYTPNIIHWKKR